MTHPLDDEDVLVILALVHTPTGTTVALSKQAPCDAPPDVDDVLSELVPQAKDALLADLESR